MLKTKAHFEHVPLEIVKKVATEITQPEETERKSIRKKLKRESVAPSEKGTIS
jgi:hypothetical protein